MRTGEEYANRDRIIYSGGMQARNCRRGSDVGALCYRRLHFPMSLNRIRWDGKHFIMAKRRKVRTSESSRSKTEREPIAAPRIFGGLDRSVAGVNRFAN